MLSNTYHLLNRQNVQYFFSYPVPNLKDPIILSFSHCGNNTIQQIIS